MKRHICLILLIAATSALADSPPQTPADPGPRVPTAVANGHAMRRQAAIGVPFSWSSEAEMNQYFVFRFIHTEGFGSGRMGPIYMSVNDLMRLVPDRKLSSSTSDSDSSKQVDITRGENVFRPDSMELIGIAKHEKPVAYSQKPSVGTGERFPTRSLTAFEIQSLDDLRGGKEVAVEDTANGRNVVGAIRAGKACLECHTGFKTGELLGAFTYHLSPARPLDASQITQYSNRGRSATLNQRSIEMFTTMGHLESARVALQASADTLQKATRDEHGENLEKLTKAIDQALAHIADAMTFVEAHPDVNPMPHQRPVSNPVMTHLPTYATEMISHFDPMKEYSGALGGQTKTIAVGPEDKHGIRIDQDGKGLSVSVIQTISHLNEAWRQFYGPFGISSNTSDGMTEYRDKIVNDLTDVERSALEVLDYVHEHSSGTPVEPKFTGPGVRPSN